MEGWPLGPGQSSLFGLLDAIACGVRLTEQGFLVPRKTLTFVLGLGACVAAGGEGEACDSCAARPRCGHRSPHGSGR
jgi:hypothetical protein